MTPDDPRHGTTAGRFAHKRAGQPACDRCAAAATRDQKQRRLDVQRGKPARTVPVLGTRRRLQALSRLGWPADDLAARLGHRSARMVRMYLSGSVKTLNRDTATQIAALYERLSMTVGPNSVVAARAATKGWPGPFAWDDPDNPREKPKDRSTAAARVRRVGPETEDSRRAAHAAWKRGERTEDVIAGEREYQRIASARGRARAREDDEAA